VESKNGAVIRKHMGFDHIASNHADSINVFYREHFNPYLNFHRPCGVPQLKKDSKGKTIRMYNWYATPWEILRQTPAVAGCLKDDLTIEQTGTASGGGQRCRCGDQDAGSEEETVWQLRKQESGMTAKGLRGNAGLWTARKTKNRFPIAAHKPLEIACHDFHIPAAPATTAVGKWKSKSRIPTFPQRFHVHQINQKRKEINPSPKPGPSGSSQD